MAADTTVADELEAIRQVKARYCRFLDTKDFESWRAVFTTDVVAKVDLAVSTGGADPMTTPALAGVDQFVPAVLAGIGDAATVHHCHTPEIALTSDETATAIWAMEDWLVFGRARITRRGSLPRDLRKAGRHMANQDPALDQDYPAVGR
jgi:SnoaL-like domain